MPAEVVAGGVRQDRHAAGLAVLIGAALLSVMSVPAAIVGARTRLSSYMIIELTYGWLGAKFINFWLGLFLLGWYAVTAELFEHSRLRMRGLRHRRQFIEENALAVRNLDV